MARPRHSYNIMYAGCSITWASQLQTDIALISTESEFIGLSMAQQTTIQLMELAMELKLQGFNMVSTKFIVHCQVFEDNSGVLKIANVPTMHLR